MNVARLDAKPNFENIPHMLRELADRIESGSIPGMQRVFVVINADDLDSELYGMRANRAELIGLLEFVKRDILDA